MSDVVEVRDGEGRVSDVQGVSAARLRSFVERLERLDEERRAVAEQFKDVLGEAKGEGYDAGTIRKVLALRRLKPHVRAEADELLDVYKTALGME